MTGPKEPLNRKVENIEQCGCGNAIHINAILLSRTWKKAKSFRSLAKWTSLIHILYIYMHVNVLYVNVKRVYCDNIRTTDDNETWTKCIAAYKRYEIG